MGISILGDTSEDSMGCITAKEQGEEIGAIKNQLGKMEGVSSHLQAATYVKQA